MGEKKMKSSERKRLLDVVKRRVDEVAKLRDAIRADMEDLVDLEDSCDEALTALESAVEALSKYA